MPVIITSQETHPFLPSLGNPSAIDQRRALRQDIRPLEIAIINLMADKQATERQLAQWIGHTPLQVHLTFIATDSYMAHVREGRETKNTPAEHIHKFYNAWSDVKHRKFDGLIVTGVNALQERVEQEAIWPEVEAIFAWSKTNVFSSLFLCWGAKAALKYFHGIDSLKADVKTFGLFEHRLMSDKTGVAFGLPDRFSVPVSRWKSPRREDIVKVKALEIVADAPEAGPNILVESELYEQDTLLFPRRLYVLNHPEYDTDTLGREYVRDAVGNPAAPLPAHYYPENDPSEPAFNSWRHTGFLYTNWVKIIYAATPYNIENVPSVGV
ncbi:MAG TPA: homoserine O-succinyltransferase [Rhodospirillaceae bacterium]|nr:homoserine O-succinyltransferase [Rhodospirillaceae bacterium]